MVPTGRPAPLPRLLVCISRPSWMRTIQLPSPRVLFVGRVEIPTRQRLPPLRGGRWRRAVNPTSRAVTNAPPAHARGRSCIGRCRCSAWRHPPAGPRARRRAVAPTPGPHRHRDLWRAAPDLGCARVPRAAFNGRDPPLGHVCCGWQRAGRTPAGVSRGTLPPGAPRPVIDPADRHRSDGGRWGVG